MQQTEANFPLSYRKQAAIGTLLLPLGGISLIPLVIGAFFLLKGMLGLLSKSGIADLRKTFTLGLMLAIAGGLWAKHTLENHGFDIPRLMVTSLVSGTGLYLQSKAYSALARVEGTESLELGGILLVIGAATFWFYLGFLPLTFGVILLFYSFLKEGLNEGVTG